jgi:hypothetical protein
MPCIIQTFFEQASCTATPTSTTNQIRSHSGDIVNPHFELTTCSTHRLYEVPPTTSLSPVSADVRKTFGAAPRTTWSFVPYTLTRTTSILGCGLTLGGKSAQATSDCASSWALEVNLTAWAQSIFRRLWKHGEYKSSRQGPGHASFA